MHWTGISGCNPIRTFLGESSVDYNGLYFWVDMDWIGLPGLLSEASLQVHVWLSNSLKKNYFNKISQASTSIVFCVQKGVFPLGSSQICSLQLKPEGHNPKKDLTLYIIGNIELIHSEPLIEINQMISTDDKIIRSGRDWFEILL